MSPARALPAFGRRSDRRSAVALVRPTQSGPIQRHLRTHGPGRRDPRRFGDLARPSLAQPPAASVVTTSDSLRFFVQAFAGAFLFVTVFIA